MAGDTHGKATRLTMPCTLACAALNACQKRNLRSHPATAKAHQRLRQPLVHIKNPSARLEREAGKTEMLCECIQQEMKNNNGTARSSNGCGCDRKSTIPPSTDLHPRTDLQAPEGPRSAHLHGQHDVSYELLSASLAKQPRTCSSK
jgi:hypothetical protein